MGTKTLAEYFILSLPYVMGVVFMVGAFLRFMIWYTVKRHEWFAREFEKRVSQYMETQVPGQSTKQSFYVLSKKILERTYYEAFEVRDRMMRRQRDKVMRWSDRIWLVKQGCAWLVKDILKQLKFLKWTNDTPKLLHITRATFHHNPCFNRVFGVFPISGLNDIVSILPGLFVVAGILGTFIGIAKGLPELGNMNLADADATKNVMDRFLFEISFAMKSSIFGIAFSLALNMVNTTFSPDRVFVSMVDRFESSLDLIWYRSDNNDYPSNEKPFDEHKDPQEALAEESINLEIAKAARSRELDELKKTKAS
ncbi:MAG: hypothetical protein JNM24_01930 [Bdellovibrionaceae bacterium]|nr:hypothetical protein [Pseudobdellovibrionaceae bacterium]